MAYCPNCGEPTDDTSRFCIHCGAPMDDSGSSYPPDPHYPNKKKTGPIIAAAAVIVLIVFGVFAYFTWFSGGGSATYIANYNNIKVRNGHSTKNKQVDSLEEGETVVIDKVENGVGVSKWGRIEDTDNWVCISDKYKIYMVKE